MDNDSRLIALDDVDLSIVFTQLNPQHDAETLNPFWRAVSVRETLPLSARKNFNPLHITNPICLDYGVFASKIAQIHELDISSTAEVKKIERPFVVDDQVAECTPQFILRNIPKIERYYDLDARLPFNLDDFPLDEITQEILDARNTRIEELEFPDHDSIAYVNDFRAFLEEIFYLCPWDHITKKAPPEDNPWHIKNSISKLAKDILENRHRVFIYTDKGVKPQTWNRDDKKKSVETHANPLTQGLQSFGPRNS